MNDLEANLADTLELIIRVGMNSRSVIPGVLPGEKGRFQLYVDTMDTASRMESNVVPGRLHVSQATADELMARGKKHLLTPREETIVAKGKGELQTYFVDSKTAKICPVPIPPMKALTMWAATMISISIPSKKHESPYECVY